MELILIIIFLFSFVIGLRILIFSIHTRIVATNELRVQERIIEKQKELLEKEAELEKLRQHNINITKKD